MADKKTVDKVKALLDGHVYGPLKEAAEKWLAEADEKYGDKFDEFKEKGAETLDKLGEVAEKYSDKSIEVTEKLAKVSDKISEGADKLSEKAAPVVDSLKEKAAPKIEELKGKKAREFHVLSRHIHEVGETPLSEEELLRIFMPTPPPSTSSLTNRVMQTSE